MGKSIYLDQIISPKSSNFYKARIQINPNMHHADGLNQYTVNIY